MSRPSGSTWWPKITSANFCAPSTEQYQTTVLLTTHDLDDIEELCRRILIIDHGQRALRRPARALNKSCCAPSRSSLRVRDSEQAARLGARFRAKASTLDRVDELTFRMRFDRAKYPPRI